MQSDSLVTTSSVARSPSVRHSYRLRFIGIAQEGVKEVEFASFDAAEALIIAEKEAFDQAAELWCDGDRLCTIRKMQNGAWEIRGHEKIC